jgi:hypothetical protein
MKELNKKLLETRAIADAFKKHGQDPRSHDTSDFMDGLKHLQENCIYSSFLLN